MPFSDAMTPEQLERFGDYLRHEEPRQRGDRPAARTRGAGPVLAGLRALPAADAAAQRHPRTRRAPGPEQAAGRP